jgi:soluble lytic murein transglycosylase-like protein
MPRTGARPPIPPRTTRLSPSSFPAMTAVADGPPAARRTARRRTLRCGMIAVALLIGSGMGHAKPAAAAPRAGAEATDPFAAFMAEASQRFGIPASWIRAVMQAESAGDAHALSPKGAMGLMQIMPQTWSGLRLRYRLGANPYDPHDNILAGAAYLRELHDRYGEPGFLAAYNAGPARYEDHLATGRPLPAATEAYVAALAPLTGGGSIDGAVVVAAAARPWTDAPLFAAHGDSGAAATSMAPGSRSGPPPTVNTTSDWTGLAPQAAGLFVPLRKMAERAP